jgi:hypothetical protein
VRAQLGPLKDFGERLNIGLSTITHPPKNAGASAFNHFIGSQAFIASSRVGHLSLAEMDEDEEGERTPTGRVLFTNVRNTTNKELMPTLAYRKEEVMVDPFISAPHVVWDKTAVDITADAAIAAAFGKKGDMQPKVQAFLRELLMDGKGSVVPQKDIEEAAEKKGFTDKQLRTAKEKLHIESFKEPGKIPGRWFWYWPRSTKNNDAVKAGDKVEEVTRPKPKPRVPPKPRFT